MRGTLRPYDSDSLRDFDVRIILAKALTHYDSIAYGIALKGRHPPPAGQLPAGLPDFDPIAPLGGTCKRARDGVRIAPALPEVVGIDAKRLTVGQFIGIAGDCRPSQRIAGHNLAGLVRYNLPATISDRRYSRWATTDDRSADGS